MNLSNVDHTFLSNPDSQHVEDNAVQSVHDDQIDGLFFNTTECDNS